MLFNSGQFLIFFPLVVMVYFIIPNRIRYIWLLVSSYYFYMCWNAKYAILLLTSTVITYLSGLMLGRISAGDVEEKTRNFRRKLVVFVSFASNIGILFYFKYTNFLIDTLDQLFQLIHVNLVIPQVDILLPVGISFFTFQALSYTMDVYRGEIYEEKNFLRYALFVSFFPQLVAGPIERSKNLLKQLATPSHFDFDNFREGILLMIWGYFLKIVIADRVSIVVDTIYGDVSTYGGMYLVVATVLFAFQIYGDFAGYSTIAMGAAKILGVQLMENFNAPYMADSVMDFWRRWHISLSSWFKDYLYIPLGGSRRGKTKKLINKMIVFLVSGLWHGAQWSYVAWGGLNGLYQVIGELLMPVRNKVNEALHFNRNAFSHKLIKIFGTFVLVDFAWIFFRAKRFLSAFQIIKSMIFVHNPWILFDDSLYSCGLDRKNFNIMLLAIAILIGSDCLKYKGICIRKFILEQEYWFRWAVFAGSIFLILIFGIWGNAYEASSFIYFQF